MRVIVGVIWLVCISEMVGAVDVISADEQLKSQAEALSEALETLGSGDLLSVSIKFSLDESLSKEGYSVKIESGKVWVVAADSAGAAYAAADLIRRAKLDDAGAISWEDSSWEEAPDFHYRSFLVDMGRNPHSPKTLQHVVDMMWFYRGNYLQLHLTDDQLFSWPSKAYPELYSPNAGWTLDDFRELEAYSQARGITIVPELEVPGHSSILRGRRPDVFGKTTNELATSAKAQRGVETLIVEMLEVFRSTPYVHIGADEVHGVSQDDQRKFINRLNQFVKSQGRKTVVWEGPAGGRVESGETKVDEDVIHMAWEGRYYPMPEMVKAGYQVVNASWDPFYIVDHYPRINFTGVPLDRIYHADFRRMKNVDPRLRSYHEPQWLEDTDSVLGFCMPWWEGREFNLLPLCVKRFGAASTRAWDYNSKLSYETYAVREAALINRLETISGFKLPDLPMAPPQKARGNLAFRGKVTPSTGANQPHFVPARLTNGITDQFDLFLGYSTKPEPLVIDIELLKPAEASRFEFTKCRLGKVGRNIDFLFLKTERILKRSGRIPRDCEERNRYVDHKFDLTKIKVVRIETDGFEEFTFPSFSRLTEVEVFAK